MTSRTAILPAALLCGLVLACRTGICPEIGCRPAIALTYRQPIAGDYVLLISLRGVTYQATCPTADAPFTLSPQVACAPNGAILSGVDLGHDSNNQVDLIVELVTGDGATTFPVTATLDYITNSRDCDLVCYQHTANLNN